MGFIEIRGKVIVKTLRIERDILVFFQKSDIDFKDNKVYYETNGEILAKRILILNGYKPSLIFDDKLDTIKDLYTKKNIKSLTEAINDPLNSILFKYKYVDYVEVLNNIIYDKTIRKELEELKNFITHDSVLEYNRIPLFDENGYIHLMDLLLDSIEESEIVRYDLTNELENTAKSFTRSTEKLKEIGLDVEINGNDIARMLLSISHYIEEEKIQSKPRIGEKIIILTEGKSDTFILSRAMKLLRPEICEYFHFMDLEGTKSQGSAGDLVNRILSFAGAGIKNKIVAIFDNDTAAYEALSKLKGINIPKNIKVTHYPILPLFLNYPTLGVTGEVNMDISKMACSLEMYFGKDILLKDDTYIPIQWKGYSSGVRRYQGEIIDKQEVQKAMKEKLKSCELDRTKINSFDWEGIEKILDEITNSFIS